MQTYAFQMCTQNRYLVVSWCLAGTKRSVRKTGNPAKSILRRPIGIFDDPEIVESVDDRVAYGEERIQALGKTGEVFYLVAYTWRAEARHVITAWKVGEHGRRRYEALFAKRHRGDESQG
jgi:uncharacterized DUF497 family protein